tara:strand:+ start:37 stop:513 length:477 start_codon:yes stop_codon:yes gene_type:complete
MPYKDKEKRLECVRQWRLRNTLRIKAWKREYRQIHRHRLADYKRIRNIEKQRKGKYEHGIRGREENIRIAIFRLSRVKTKETGIPHHVDHIVPLQGITVSGFHIFGNLRIVRADFNLKKSNTFTKEAEELTYQRMKQDWIANGVKFKLYKPKKQKRSI